MSEVLFAGWAQRDSRAVSIRYFNIYRMLLATVFAVFGGVMSFGQKAPEMFAASVITYWVFSFSVLLLHAVRPVFGGSTLAAQSTLDIVILAFIMYASGGYRSGVPFLMMTSIAGAGLVGAGRTVLGAASVATITVLTEQSFRVFDLEGSVSDFPQVAITCTGFFAVALVARMLSRRALANESLAAERGERLARQMHVSARIIEDMQEGVIVIDPCGLIRLANPRAEALLGVRLEAGRPLAAVAAEMAEAIETLHDRDRIELSVPGGGRLQLRRHLTAVGGDFILYVEDMDSALARARQIKLAALGRLTANIAHEIRNPLSSVSHASELLLEEKRAETQERLARIIHDNASRIERIIRDVLEVGRRDRVAAETIELREFCRSMLGERISQRPDARDFIRLESAAEFQVRFDRVHLYRILTNLLDNASRYCSGSAGSVVVAIHAQDDSHVVLDVRDDGPGIPPDDRSKLFEPFFTSHPSGTGLGLYMARELADANDAVLELIDSMAGAVFRLRIRRLA